MVLITVHIWFSVSLGVGGGGMMHTLKPPLIGLLAESVKAYDW